MGVAQLTLSDIWGVSKPVVCKNTFPQIRGGKNDNCESSLAKESGSLILLPSNASESHADNSSDTLGECLSFTFKKVNRQVLYC